MLLAAAVSLVCVAAALVARAPAPTAAEPDLLAAWSERHHGIEPHGLALRWLGGMHALAPRLVRTWPAALTAAGLWCAYAAVVAAAHGQGWAVLGAALLVAGGVFDGLDGAVAALAGRVTRRGAVLDLLADRGADAALHAGLGVRGAPAWLCALAFVLVLAQEASRRGASIVTPGERPTRVILGMLGFVLWPTAAAAAIAALSVAATAQLLRSAQR
jgi:phosphatidylglycerophosphate synthase